MSSSQFLSIVHHVMNNKQDNTQRLLMTYVCISFSLLLQNLFISRCRQDWEKNNFRQKSYLREILRLCLSVKAEKQEVYVLKFLQIVDS